MNRRLLSGRAKTRCNWRRTLLFVVLSMPIGVIGCNTSSPPPATSDAKPGNTNPSPPPTAPDLTAVMLEPSEPTAQAGQTEPAAEAEDPPQEPEYVEEVATVGAGKKGHGYGGDMVSEPVRAYFRTRERIVFDVTIPNAMKTFKAMDPNNKGPKSHEEFMEKIIRENSIELPGLPDGYEYRYDPETEELMVRRPKK